MKTKMARLNEPEMKTKNDALSQKIGLLKQNTFALIQEVRELGNLSYQDLTHGIDLFEEVRRFEMKLIRQALEETDGRQVQAARMLGLKMTTLNEKIKRYGIDPRDPLQPNEEKDKILKKGET
jgi:DNA-binding NtrC family response regulator